MIYSIGWLVGWPIVLFLIAEPLRNLGKYTFADVVAFRLQPDAGPHHASAIGGILIVVIYYLIGQMVGAGQLLHTLCSADLLQAVDHHRRRADHHLRHLRRHEGHDLGADHQGRPAAGRRDPDGAAGAGALSFSPGAMFAEAVRIHPSTRTDHHEVDGADRQHGQPDRGDLARPRR